MTRRARFGLALLLIALRPVNLAAQENGCVGDCDQGGSITVDELVQIASVALGDLPLESCPGADSDHSADVTVDEILHAIDFALFGCALPDLAFVSGYAVYPVARGCNLPPVGDSGLMICIANRGRADAGSFHVRVNDSDQYVLDGLAASVTDCRLRQFSFSGSFGNAVEADFENEVVESNERNNIGSFSIAVLTATASCTRGAVPTPTPPPFSSAAPA